MKTEDILKLIRKCEDNLIIDVILDIYSGKYKTYLDYYDKIIKIKEEIEEAKQNNETTIYIDPILLDYETYEYIMSKRERV